jgi:hypothetical protein
LKALLTEEMRLSEKSAAMAIEEYGELEREFDSSSPV